MLHQDILITRYGRPEECACVFSPDGELGLFSCTGIQNDQKAFTVIQATEAYTSTVALRINMHRVTAFHAFFQKPKN